MNDLLCRADATRIVLRWIDSDPAVRSMLRASADHVTDLSDLANTSEGCRRLRGDAAFFLRLSEEDNLGLLNEVPDKKRCHSVRDALSRTGDGRNWEDNLWIVFWGDVYDYLTHMEGR